MNRKSLFLLLPSSLALAGLSVCCILPYRHGTYGLFAAIGTGALVVIALFLFTSRYERRLSRLAAERDVQRRLLTEMNALEKFRRDFISNVTHEIKTPVTGILGAAEVLADGGTSLDDSDRAELHDVIKNQSSRLTALVDDILSLAKLEMAKTKKETDFVIADVTDIVQTSVNLCRPQATKADVDLSFTTRPEHLRIERPCDPKLVESAVSNLILNALRHSGSKKVDVSVEKSPEGKASIKIADYGIGIPTECQPRIFERFYRVDKGRSRAGGGTGLGLAIVKHTVQLHGGKVTLDSAPGNGAVFTVSI